MHFFFSIPKIQGHNVPLPFCVRKWSICVNSEHTFTSTHAVVLLNTETSPPSLGFPALLWTFLWVRGIQSVLGTGNTTVNSSGGVTAHGYSVGFFLIISKALLSLFVLLERGMDLFECQGLFSSRWGLGGLSAILGNSSGIFQELCSPSSPFSWFLGVLLAGPGCCSALPPTGKIHPFIPVLGALLCPTAAWWERLWGCLAECFGNCQFNLLHLHFSLLGCAWCEIPACPFVSSCAVPAEVGLQFISNSITTWTPLNTKLIFPFFILRQAYSRGKCHCPGSSLSLDCSLYFDYGKIFFLTM